MSNYRITPIAVEGFADANGVCENRHGAWLGEFDSETVHIYADEDGDYIPAPSNWHDLVIEEV